LINKFLINLNLSTERDVGSILTLIAKIRAMIPNRKQQKSILMTESMIALSAVSAEDLTITVYTTEQAKNKTTKPTKCRVNRSP
jgi:hypothetical protein